MTQGLREVKTAFYHDKLGIFALFHSGKRSRLQSRDTGIEFPMIGRLVSRSFEHLLADATQRSFSRICVTNNLGLLGTVP